MSSFKSTRSIEGSLGVLAVSIVALVLAAGLTPQLHFTANWIWLIPGIALTCALLEAVSPHGWDNATLQIAPALLVAALL